MLPDKIELQVVTPERHILEETVDSLEMPGKDGYLGILPGHAPLITGLGIGILTYHKCAEVRYLTVIHGYAEVLPDRVIVLAESSERGEEVNIERARASLERAQGRLAKAGSPDVDWERASLALTRAMARVQAASKGGVAAAVPEPHRSAA
jgi:F-type H+-transporting ATPase subunit epsilon